MVTEKLYIDILALYKYKFSYSNLIQALETKLIEIKMVKSALTYLFYAYNKYISVKNNVV